MAERRCWSSSLLSYSDLVLLGDAHSCVPEPWGANCRSSRVLQRCPGLVDLDTGNKVPGVGARVPLCMGTWSWLEPQSIPCRAAACCTSRREIWFGYRRGGHCAGNVKPRWLKFLRLRRSVRRCQVNKKPWIQPVSEAGEQHPASLRDEAFFCLT